MRRSRAGRPVRAALGGTHGSINAHYSSVSSWRFMMADLPVVSQRYRQQTEFSGSAEFTTTTLIAMIDELHHVWTLYVTG